MSAGKVLRWTGLGILILIVIVIVAGFFILRSNKFHQYVIGKAEEKLAESTGGRVVIGSYTFQWHPLTITIHNLVIHGTEPANVRPLLSVDELDLGLKIVSLLHQKIDLKDIEVKHPVVNLVVNRAGKTNIPSPKTPTSNSKPVNVFDLGVNHAVLSGGEVYYLDRKTPLDADLLDLNTLIQFNASKSRYAGSLSYRRGRLKYGTYNPVAHDLDSKFTASPSEFTLNPAILRLENSRLTLHATVTNYKQPDLNGNYDLFLHTADFRHMMKNPSVPVGDITIAGTMKYHDQPGRPALDLVEMTGALSSPDLLVETSSARTRVTHLHGSFVLANGDFRARGLAGDLLGGHLDADVGVRNVASTNDQIGSLRASIGNLSITDAEHAIKTAEGSQVPVTGRVNGIAEAAWHGNMSKTLRARADMTLAGTINPPRTAPGAQTPLNGAVHLTYVAATQAITLTQTQLQTLATLIRVNGTVANRSNLQVQANTRNLHELETLALAFKPATPAKPGQAATPPPAIYGVASLNANVTGSTKRPNITGNLNAQNLQVQDTRWKTLQANFSASPSGVKVQRGSLVSATQGTLQFSLSAGLRDWKYEPANPIMVDVVATHMPIDQLAQMANVKYPVAGNLSANINIRGSQLNPVGNGNIRLASAHFDGFAVPRLTVDFRGNGNAVNTTTNASIAGGTIVANVAYFPKQQGYDAQLNIRQIHLGQVQKLSAMQIAGLLNATASGRGTIKDPQLDATMTVPQLTMRDKPISGITARIGVANQQANLVVDSTIAQSFVQARGTMKLTGDKYATLRLDTRGIALQTLLAVYLPQQSSNLKGELELHATASGPVSTPAAMQATLNIPVFYVTYNQLQIGAAAPIRADYRNGAVTLDRTELKGTGTDIVLQGTYPVKGNAPASFTATGGVDLGIARLLNPELSSGGRVELNVHGAVVHGTPGVRGDIRIVNASFSSPSEPMGVEKLNGVLALDNDRVVIQNFTGSVGGGQLNLTGTVAYQPAVQFNVGMTAKNVRLLYPEGMRTIFDSNLALNGNMKDANLTGRVLLDNMSFTQGFDIASFMSSSSSGATSPPGQGFTQNLHLAIAVQSTGQLGLESSQVSLNGAINVRVQGTAADPVIVGRADITSGEVFFMGRRYQIQRAIANFNNPNETQPVLNVLVTTVVNQYDISLSLIGPMDRLRTSYVSNPPLPPVDIINLLARGQTTEEANAAPSNLGANQVIASGLASQVSGQIQKLAGISSLTIDPTLGGTGTNPGARIAIQQRVTKNFYFTFSTDVTNAQQDIIQGEYQFTKHWGIEADRDETGNIGVTAKYHTSF
ncbi:MAG TPA: translocation/assembly module TamB domain-containing protein [Terriglobales bacterium]|nr:translocation/assembly module TamB domain-containing protein [Terriglobales bacterium]